MKLQARAKVHGVSEPCLLKLRTGAPQAANPEAVLWSGMTLPPDTVPGTIVAPMIRSIRRGPQAVVYDVPDLHYLSDGDVIAVRPDGFVRVLYRRSSPHNSIFVTDQCNSYCVMCSQPPKAIDDRRRVGEILQLIDLMDPSTAELGMTGGEPTLFGEDFLRIIRRVNDHLPATSLHVLTNGRLFFYRSFARAVADIAHPDLMLGIPLYSSLDWEHDFIVQARGAYDETLAGMRNLDLNGVRIEIRFVLHGLTYRHLPRLAAFVARNLPFVAQVAIMGLEPIGFAQANASVLAVDDGLAHDALSLAVETLALAGIPVALYNQQLCHLDRALWPFAVRAISDWKNDYAPECDACAVKDRCGGFFSWTPAQERFPRPFAADSYCGAASFRE
ncbi:MAG: hypothetical protein QOK37_3055 [Thermoanaerobaculia bacterium]|nr:hypothetical protein [Thermoanaerobaculia bacterium]